MTLFNSTGFAPQDSVFVILDDKKYFGVVLDTDDRLDRVKVDFTAKSVGQVKAWFHKSFWQKEII
jgi:hypothetical protein